MSTRKSPTHARAAATPKDAIAMLKADHHVVTELFEQFESSKRKDQKNKLAKTICRELTIHTTIEEEIFYPELRAADPENDVGSMLDEANVEHDGAKKLIAQIEASDASADLFDAQVKVLSEYIKHHVKEEQSDIFPKAKASELDLVEMGKRLAARKAELKTGLAQPGVA